MPRFVRDCPNSIPPPHVQSMVATDYAVAATAACR
jgi:hypothetical protein